jgi:hypothetical protein
MNCPELAQLEARLVRFNIFRILGAERAEVRHSNTLAWLFQPDETHGFGDAFLKRWLMRVMRDAEANPPVPIGWVSPVAVDVLDIEYVEVNREQDSIDLLVTIHRRREPPWVVCIENKVESGQHTRQLDRYFERVESRFAEAERRIYVLLSKYGEAPDNPEFIESSYKDIVEALDRCLVDHRDSIGPEPNLLLKHYRQLLVDDFMEENDATELARQIYLRHKRALDYIFENKVDSMYEASRALFNLLEERASDLEIVTDVLGKGWIRFLPRAWDVASNEGGKAWGGRGRFLLCEVSLWAKKAELHITIGRAPADWADKVWARAASAPFKQEWKKRPTSFVKPYKVKSNLALSDFEGREDEMGTELFGWVRSELEKPQFKAAVEALAKLLPELKAT